MSAQKPKLIRLENVPIECGACGKITGTQITILIEQPPEWEVNTINIDLKVMGRHKTCPNVQVGGALSGIHGPPDQTHLTEKGSRVDIWDHRKERKEHE